MSKSTVSFKRYFYENITVGDALGGSAGGFSPDSISSSDFYAPGDNRLAFSQGTFSRKGKVKNKSKRSRKKKRKNSKR